MLSILAAVVTFAVGLIVGMWAMAEASRDDEALIRVLENNNDELLSREQEAQGKAIQLEAQLKAANTELSKLHNQRGFALKSCQGFVDGCRSSVQAKFVNMKEGS